MKKTLVLTSITNGKDNLYDPPQKFDNCDYIAFVDKTYDVKIWEQRPVTEFSTIDGYNTRRNAKSYKILSSLMFPEYEYIIWEDGTHQLKADPEKIYNEYGEFDLLLFKHPDRSCIFQELDIVNRANMDDRSTIQNQVNFYKSKGMPEKWGLFEMGTFIKKNNPIVKKFELMWWEQICKFSSRDQTSLPYVLWKMGGSLIYKYLKGYVSMRSQINGIPGNEYFVDQRRHLK